MICRPNTQDFDTLTEIREYAALDIRPGDVCLDLGANCGAWTLTAVESATALVVAVEPDPENFKALCLNTDDSPHAIKRINAAVARCREMIPFNRSQLSTCHTSRPAVIGPIGQIEVVAVTLPDLIREYGPTVIKCDIEGGEHNLDWDCLENVRELAMEVHWFMEGDILSATGLISVIEAQGFKPLHDPSVMRPPNPERCHVQVGVWKR